MGLDLYQVDAFTDRAFAGNPAAVCLLPAPRPAAWMQSVAREMNLSETAFLVPRMAVDPIQAGFDLRWFTPAVEVELCGHATLASAHVLWETGRLGAAETARFHTLSGLLTAERRVGAEGSAGDIELDFPARPVAEVSPPPGLLEAFGRVTPRFVGKSRFDYLLELETEDLVRGAAPDCARLRTLPVRGVIITAPGSGPYDFVSRFFAPGAGVDEDPVTGSAHCTLGPYWSERLGKSSFRAFQASARGGELRVEVAGDRVKLGGRAVTVLRGELVGD
jgi:predicted PhzF superfamily epimerase YddE/YHI9